MRVRRFALIAASLCCAAAIFGSVAPVARADTVTLTFRDLDGNVDATALVARAVEVSGNVSAVAELYVRYRPAGGVPCAASPRADPGEEIASLYDREIAPAGPFSFDVGVIFPAPGLQMLCIWLGSASTPSDATPSTPILQLVSVRAPTGAVSAVAAPASEPSTPATSISVTATSDFPVFVRATYQPAGMPCAATYAADAGTTFLDTHMITSGRFTFTQTVPLTSGAWTVCSWLETDDAPPHGITRDMPFIGPATDTFTAVGPPAAPVPSVPVPPAPDPVVPQVVATASARSATRIRASFPHTSARLRLSVSSRVTANTKPGGACWLEVLHGGTWKAPGAHAPVTAKGTCVVTARFAAPGRLRLRVELRPAAGLPRVDSAASWVKLTR